MEPPIIAPAGRFRTEWICDKPDYGRPLFLRWMREQPFFWREGICASDRFNARCGGGATRRNESTRTPGDFFSPRRVFYSPRIGVAEIRRGLDPTIVRLERNNAAREPRMNFESRLNATTGRERNENGAGLPSNPRWSTLK
jgi:hypothetical protein